MLTQMQYISYFDPWEFTWTRWDNKIWITHASEGCECEFEWHRRPLIVKSDV